MQVVIIGASDNPERYSYRATEVLLKKRFNVVLVGLKNKTVLNHEIQPVIPPINDDVVITLYLGPKNQDAFIQDIILLHPLKVIFNPGTENPMFQQILNDNNIEWEDACTLVKLSLNQFP